MNVNIVHLVGRLGQDPERKGVSNNGKPKVEFSLATNRSYGDNKTTDWHTIQAWGSLAENVESYVKKGSEVFVVGRIEYSKWTDKEGNQRSKTYIIANRVEFGAKQAPQESSTNNHKGDDDDVPF